jgi:hypothetical protein
MPKFTKEELAEMSWPDILEMIVPELPNFKELSKRYFSDNGLKSVAIECYLSQPEEPEESANEIEATEAD